MEPQPPQLTPALAALRDRLLAMPQRDGAALAAALAAAPVTFDDVRGFVSFGDEDYVRALIYRNDDLELRLHCWRRGSRRRCTGTARRRARSRSCAAQRRRRCSAIAIACGRQAAPSSKISRACIKS